MTVVPLPDRGPDDRGGGLIGIFARHRTAANLVMVLMIVAGAFALMKLNRQFFPDFGIDMVTVTVAWSGASADDVDANIIQAIEPEVRFLDDVKQVNSTAYEGVGVVQVEFNDGADMQRALSEVESAVAQITTFPDSAEDPKVRRIIRYDDVSRLLISGPFPPAALKAYAKRIRDDLLARGVDKIDIKGTSDDEIWVEIAPETLRRINMTLSEVAAQIDTASRDVPAGELAGGERQVRSLGLRESANDLGDVEVRALPNGSRILLRDIAILSDTFEEGGVDIARQARSAVELQVKRATNADALITAEIIDRYLTDVRPLLPATLKIEQFDVASDLIRDRIRILVNNGLSGLVLVVITLFVFLNARIAFWVAVGVPVSVMATFAAMWATGQTINMISLFGLIMAIGIVVDDAIVVGEHADSLAAGGMRPLHAATRGARRMAAPVISSTLTTIAAFMPLLVIGDIIGQVISAIPYVVIAILVASLIECFLVLPTHLRGALRNKRDSQEWRLRRWFDRGFERFRNGPFRTFVHTCITWRYATIAGTLAILMISIGLVAGGRLKFNFFPTPEADTVFANVEMVAGSTRDETRAALDRLLETLDATNTRLGDGKLVQFEQSKVGETYGTEFGSTAATDTLGGIKVQLITADIRDVRTKEFIEAWEEATQAAALSGVKNWVIRAPTGGPPGRALDIRLIGQDIQPLKQAAEDLRQNLERFAGIYGIEDDLPYGTPEILLDVNERGRALGFTTASVADQVRGALDGAIAQRFARGDEEVTIRVRYPRATTDTGVLDSLYLRAPGGAEVPLTSVVDFTERLGFSQIKRSDGNRQVAVTAEIDPAVTNIGEISAALTRPGDAGAPSILGRISDQYGVNFEFRGKAEEQANTFADMRLGAILGLIAIYVILAWVFASYGRPVAVMLVIPLGIIGAFWGHYLLDMNVTILTMIGLIGLSGIIINDSIVLVTTIDERLANQDRLSAIVDGSCDRLRAVLLTSITTVGGLVPLLFEQSLQAQFLQPMVVTIVFGLGFGTLLVLVVVPAIIAIQGDFSDFYHWMSGTLGGRRRPSGAPEDAASAVVDQTAARGPKPATLPAE